MVTNAEDDDGCREADTNGASDLDAGHPGHHEVGDDEVGRPLAIELETFIRVVSGADIIALGGESSAQDASDLGFVVDD